jgi:hypothetical protein
MGTQDIKITPRTGGTTGVPEILFQGSGTTASGITMSVHGSGDIVYDGHQGELLRLSSNLQTGTIFSVKDISGLDQISLDASGDINLNGSYGTTWFGSSGTYGTTNLDANTNNYAIISGDNNPVTQFSRDGNTYIQIIAGDAAATTSRQAQLYVTAGTAGNSKILLGDTDDTDSCLFNYAHSTNDLKLAVNGTTYFRWESEGTMFFKEASSSPAADTNGGYIWNEDLMFGGQKTMNVMDSAGNVTMISPHAADAPEWLYDWDVDRMSPKIVRELNHYAGIVRYTNYTRQARLLERLLNRWPAPTDALSRKVIHEETFEEYNARTGHVLEKIDWDTDQLRMRTERDAEIAAWEAMDDEDKSGDPRPEEHATLPKPEWLIQSEANA